MYRSLFILCALLVPVVGCGTKEVPSAVSEKPTESAPVSASSQAVQTVTDFMAAMLRGEDEKIRTLLTPIARKAGEEKGVPFSPAASDTATFTIDKAVPNGSAAASVFTTLTDIDPETEQKESSEIVWTVVQTEEGWRVSGALVALFDGQPKIQINFEDPEATQQALAEAEAKAKQKQGSKLAQ